jgi:hypothetical protein
LAAARYPLAPLAPGSRADCLAECAGVFRSGKTAAHTFVAQDGVMHVHATGRGFEALVPGGAGAVTLGPAMRLVFARDGAGRATAVRVTDRGDEYTAARTDEPLPPRATLPDAPAYAGRYTLSPALQFDVQASGGQLAVRLGNQPRFAVYAVAGQPDRFAYDVVKAELQFERDAGGRVVALVLHQNGQHRAPKVE